MPPQSELMEVDGEPTPEKLLKVPCKEESSTLYVGTYLPPHPRREGIIAYEP